MENPTQEGKGIQALVGVLILVAVVFFAWRFIRHESKPVAEEFKNTSEGAHMTEVVDEIDKVITLCRVDELEECKKYFDEKKEYHKKANETGKDIGCSTNDFPRCKSGWKIYKFTGEKWEETEESKSCSPYADSKVSDLPIKCLDYFGLKN